MKKTFQISILYLFIFVLVACRQSTSETAFVQRIGDENTEQTAPYLTTDPAGNPVLCWTEKDPADSLNRLKYAVYNADKGQFDSPVTVSASVGGKVSEESMSKIAFKSDGTVMAVFAKRFENEKNKYAGAICYSMSSDRGINWSPAKYLHSDTSHTYGRGYFDIATLNNGEVAAVWLDGRYSATEEGSAIFFSSTKKGTGFEKDTCINKSTCECCRTDLLADKNTGVIHIAYRNIRYPDALMGKQARDIVYTTSSDNGHSFTPEKVISEDNWAINGCPHTGPSLAANKSGINAAWFTSGGSPGLYYSSKPESGTEFNGRKLITATGRHPQMVSLSDGRLAIICEEEVDGDSIPGHAGGHAHGETEHKATAGIVLNIIADGRVGKTMHITDGKYADHHAVMMPLKDGLLTSWIREEGGKSGVYYSIIKSL